MKFGRTTLPLILLGALFSNVIFSQKTVNKITKNNKFLFLDDRLIENYNNAKLVVGTVQKNDANPLFVEDKPWEKRYDNLYGNIIYNEDEDLYQCWYSPFIVDYSAKGMTLAERKNPYEPPSNREMGICYAYSNDGINWKKPELDLVEFEGTKSNNIINTSIFIPFYLFK